MRFRSSKNPRQFFTVQAHCVTRSGIYHTGLGDMQMAAHLTTIEQRHICRVTLQYGQYRLSVPYDEQLPRAPSVPVCFRPRFVCVPGLELCRLGG